MANPSLAKATNTPDNITLGSTGSVADLGKQLLALETELNDLFPERDFLLRQMTLAVLVRAHVLTHGTHGTGKSMLIRAFSESLGVGKHGLFAIELTRHTTENDVFGAINVPLLREQGIHMRNPEGTLRTAVFANIGEFFDAPMLVRALLSVLNEREYTRGLDTGKVPLHTAFASTNIAPQELVKRLPENQAVVDRFLFQCEVASLKTDEGLRSMLLNFNANMKPSITIAYSLLEQATQIIEARAAQLTDGFFEPFLAIVMAVREQWASKGWRHFSDRAICQWMIVPAANAFLHGRGQMSATDLTALKYVICNGSDQQTQAFDKIANPIIEKAIEEEGEATMSVDYACILVMQRIRMDWPDAPEKGAGDGTLATMLRLFTNYQTEANKLKPELAQTRKDTRQLRVDIQERLDLINALLIAGE